MQGIIILATLRDNMNKICIFTVLPSTASEETLVYPEKKIFELKILDT